MIPDRTFNILVVDDVFLMCDFLYKVIRSIPNCNVLKANDGRTALDILESEAIDMLITDIEMKAPNGLELLKRLRCGTLNTAHHIPVLMFSGNTYKDMVLESQAYDINDFLAKPVSAASLKQKVQHHLCNAKTIQAPEYYKKIVYTAEKKEAKKSDPDFAAEPFRSQVAIVRNVVTQVQKGYAPSAEEDTKIEAAVLVIWPEHSTTGFHQLDRRMAILAQRVNFFHNLHIKESKAIALATEQKRISEAIDYLVYIGEKLQPSTNNQPIFWSFFKERIDLLSQLGQELMKINPKLHSQTKTWLKKFTNWWVQTINRPFIQSTESSNNE